MTGTLVIGIDPGMTTGVFAGVLGATEDVTHNLIAVQIHGAEGVQPFVTALLRRDIDQGSTSGEPIMAIEKFVVGHRSTRSRHPAAGETTRNLIGALEQITSALGVRTYVRPAAAVKPWATDRRLEAAGLLEACGGMRHTRDAARHALFAAVHAGLMTDPLSKAGVVQR